MDYLTLIWITFLSLMIFHVINDDMETDECIRESAFTSLILAIFISSFVMVMDYGYGLIKASLNL